MLLALMQLVVAVLLAEKLMLLVVVVDLTALLINLITFMPSFWRVL
jgi:hypothetical protein